MQEGTQSALRPNAKRDDPNAKRDDPSATRDDPNAKRDDRKLTAIAFIDVVGYSRLIGFDDQGTRSRLDQLRRVVIEPALLRHAGRIANIAGDGTLISFDSVIGAVRFAIELQRALPEFDGHNAVSRQLRVRIGITVGDVIRDGEDVHGDGVNIAARLQTICPPSAICVSRAVRDQVSNKLGLPFKELGAVGLKNIADPVEAFVLDPLSCADPATITIHAKPASFRKRRQKAILLTLLPLVAGLAALAALFWPGFSHPASKPLNALAAAGQDDLPPLSIAVLPFDNLSGDPEQQYLADGIAEDLTTDLSHLTGAFVIARESSFSFRGKQIDIRDIARQLGVRFLLEGSVRKMSDSVRINAQLIAADTGAHVWAERFDKQLSALGLGEDDIVQRLGSALDVQLVNLEGAQRSRPQPANPAAVDFVLRARAVRNQPMNDIRFHIALGLYEQALLLDKDSVPAMAGVASMLASGFTNLRHLQRAEDLIAKAEQQAPRSPDVLAAKFLLLRKTWRYGESVAVFRQLLDVDSSGAGIAAQAQPCNACWGPPEQAAPLLERTIRLNPRSPAIGILYVELGRAYLLLDRNAEARALFQSALSLPELDVKKATDGPALAPNARRSALLDLGVADARLGSLQEAHQDILQALRSDSMVDYTVRAFIQSIPRFDEPREIAMEMRIADGLRLAGLREHLDETADSGVASTGEIQDSIRLNSPTPMTVPGGATIQTEQLAAKLADQKPLILATTDSNPTIPGAILLPYTFGKMDDQWQAGLQREMTALNGSDLDRPIVTFAASINRWHARNLALRLIALGYRNVFWYRGGWEAWDAAGLPEAPLTMRIQ